MFFLFSSNALAFFSIMFGVHVFMLVNKSVFILIYFFATST